MILRRFSREGTNIKKARKIIRKQVERYNFKKRNVSSLLLNFGGDEVVFCHNGCGFSKLRNFRATVDRVIFLQLFFHIENFRPKSDFQEYVKQRFRANYSPTWFIWTYLTWFIFSLSSMFSFSKKPVLNVV